MSLSIQDNPASGWAARGQKLIFAVESDEITMTGFKYGVVVTDLLTGKEYKFLYDADPVTGYLYFDLYPLILLRNEDQTINPHTAPIDAPVIEPQGSGWNAFELEFSEWWVVSNVLTKNEETMVFIQSQAVFNAYYQQSNGYQPNEESGPQAVRFSMPFGSQSRFWSDRDKDTHVWQYESNFESIGIDDTAIVIPAYKDDYGSLAMQSGTAYLKENDAYGVEMYFYYGSITSPSILYKRFSFASPTAFLHVGVFPQNLELATTANTPKPSLYPDWIYYTIRAITDTFIPLTPKYLFYNADVYGQHDCRHNLVRIAWVGSRAGWEYFNFIKRNEYSNETDRKQFVRGLFSSPTNGAPYFLPNARVWNDRQVISQQYLSIQSDWIQEHEFELLRSLFVSNQVEIVQADGSRIPVSLEENTFVEKRARDGKLVNVQMKLKIGHYYWT